MNVTPMEPPNRMRELALRATAIAEMEIGNGEEGGNNRGPHVRRYRAGKGGRGAWCAAFVQWCFEAAATELGYTLPWERTHGAKALAKRIARVGRVVDWRSGQLPRRGDAICWHRGRLPWQGHVGIVSEFSLEGRYLRTIEGNRGRIRHWSGRTTTRDLHGRGACT